MMRYVYPSILPLRAYDISHLSHSPPVSAAAQAAAPRPRNTSRGQEAGNTHTRNTRGFSVRRSVDAPGRKPPRHKKKKNRGRRVAWKGSRGETGEKTMAGGGGRRGGGRRGRGGRRKGGGGQSEKKQKQKREIPSEEPDRGTARCMIIEERGKGWPDSGMRPQPGQIGRRIL